MQGIADWLDDDSKVHPCDFRGAYKGFEITMALCRSVAERGQVRLPLVDGRDELKILQKKMPDARVMLSTQANAKEYLGIG